MGTSLCWCTSRFHFRTPLLSYINDLSKDISSTVKLFADDTSIFSVVDDVNVSVVQLNSDLLKISKWAYQWKMSFNPDVSKQAQEVVFSRKSHKLAHPPVFFNNVQVKRCSIQKHLGFHLDEKLNFNHHVKEKITKANKGIGVIKKLSNILPRDALLTIYKSFVIPHLDYSDIIYDQPQNESCCTKLESNQYNAALAITGAIRGTSKVKLYKELGLEFLKNRRWFRQLCTFYKIKTYKIPPYFGVGSNTRNSDDITTFQSRTETFKFSFFPWSIVQWNKLDLKIQNSSYLVFRNYLIKRIQALAAPAYNTHNPLGLKLLTRLRLGLSHLNNHRFNHNFDNCLNPLCSTCSFEVESTTHFFLHCHHFNAIHITLNNSLKAIDKDILKLSDSFLTKIILYGDSKCSDIQNHDVLNSTITYILDSKRFDCLLL